VDFDRSGTVSVMAMTTIIGKTTIPSGRLS